MSCMIKQFKLSCEIKKTTTRHLTQQLSIGYNEAATLIERMENKGVISVPDSEGKREILIPLQEFDNMTNMPVQDKSEHISLVNCPECGKQISRTNKFCSNCGYKLNQSKIDTSSKKQNKKEGPFNSSEQASLNTPIMLRNILICLFFGWIIYSCCHKEKLDEQKKAEWCKNNPVACAQYEEEVKRWYDCQGLRQLFKVKGSKVGKLLDDCPLPLEPWK